MDLKQSFKTAAHDVVAECSPTIAAFAAATYWSGADVMHLAIFSAFVFSGYRSQQQETQQALKNIKYSDAPNKLQNRFYQRTKKDDPFIDLKLVTQGVYKDGAFAGTEKGKKIIAVGENLYKHYPLSALEFVIEHERGHFNHKKLYKACVAEKTARDATGFSVLLSIVSGVSGPYAAGVTLLFAAGWLGQSLLTNALSRKLEYKCDQEAADRLGTISGACQFFLKLGSHGREHPFRSHPTHENRVKRLTANSLNQQKIPNSPSHDIV